MRAITVYFDDGDTITTSINGTDDQIIHNYLGNRFEAGSDTEHHTALLVHFHDTDRRWGLVCRNIESDSTGQIVDVRRETVLIDDVSSYEEVTVATKGGHQYAINDLWVYGPTGQYLPKVGYPHATVER
jgi:hypothetical protein